MELPYSLQTLPPEAVDILRYYATLNADSAHTDSIVDGAGLTDRGFGKGIRRLVTKNYLVMSSDQVYRLTEQGKRVITELKASDSDSGSKTSGRSDERFIRRRLILVTPRTLVTGQASAVAVGFDEAADEEYLNAPVNLLLRFSVLNGEPRRPREVSFMLTNRHVQHPFEVTAGKFTAARMRIEVLQYRDEGDDFDFCGGMYVDLPVKVEDANPNAEAFGVDVILKEEQ